MTGLWILFGFKFVSEIVIFFAAFKMSISMSEWCLSVTGPEMLWNIPKICTWYRWARSDQGHYDHELFLRITCICIDVTAKCSDNIGTGLLYSRIALTQTKSSFRIPVERFYWNMRIIDWEWDLLLTFNISISFMKLIRRVC